METKFNFKSAICTSKIQSERLLALGLKPETADMCYKVTTHDWRGHEIPEKDKHYSLCNWYDELNIVCGFEQVKTIPAWSLHRILSMLPDDAPRIYWILDGANITIYFEDDCGTFFPYKGNIYEGVVNCIEWLIKEGYFNKEYLV